MSSRGDCAGDKGSHTSRALTARRRCSTARPPRCGGTAWRTTFNAGSRGEDTMWVGSIMLHGWRTNMELTVVCFSCDTRREAWATSPHSGAVMNICYMGDWPSQRGRHEHLLPRHLAVVTCAWQHGHRLTAELFRRRGARGRRRVAAQRCWTAVGLSTIIIIL